MLKYMLGSLAALALVVVAAFALIAWRNGDDAQAGLPRLIVVRVTERGLEPEAIEVPRGQLVRLRMVNDAPALRLATAEGGIEQLPPETGVFDPDAPTQPLPSLRLQAPPGGENEAYVRFREGDSRDVRIETPGRPETAQVLRVMIR